MKAMRYFFQIIFLLIFSTVSAQQDKEFSVASNQLKVNRKLIEKISIPESEPGHTILALQVPFSNAEFIAPLLASAAEGKIIEKVQLVYTTFRVSPDFDQQKLNQQRLKNLFSLLPSAFSNPMTEWELIGQTGAKSPEEGKTYFHGFVITWRPDASASLVKNEMNALDSLFLPKIRHDELISHISKKDSLKMKTGLLTNADGTKTELDRNIPEDSLWRYIKSGDKNFDVVSAKWGDSAHTTVVVIEENESGKKLKRTWKLEDHFSDEPTGMMNEFDLHNPDSVVTSVMRRNNWNNVVLVTDVTGSMSPYTSQVLAWVPIGLAAEKCAGFVFFNDGDGKTTNQKDVGKTGGIYSIQTHSFDSVYFMMKKTMNAGDGGDLAENPVEASIYSLNHFPKTSEIVLIADNFSSPRDLELFAKVNRPLHIVLCGARGTVNPDYLFLARQTHGTVHTVHNDILNLSDMKDGDVVEIEGKHYLLRDEHFICLESFSPVLN